jgi:hypothetical protein
MTLCRQRQGEDYPPVIARAVAKARNILTQ